jgi:hypothetical protein
MAIAITALTSSYDNVDRTTYTTASVSPTASRWLVLDTFARFAGAQPTPVVSGLSLTWVTELTVTDFNNALMRLGRYYAWTGAAPGSGTISIDYSPTTMIGAGWVVYEMSGANTSDPFVQSVGVDPNTTDTSTTVTLSAFGNAANRPVISSFHNRFDEGSDPDTTPSAYTELADVFGANPSCSFAVAWNSANTDTTPSYSWLTSVNLHMALASEIADAGAAGSTVVDPFGMSGFFGG